MPCIGCWECVEGNIQAVVQSLIDPGSAGKGDIECSENPAAGREADCAIVPATTAKRVVVVGGGPAGMEAARMARLRGHEVTLMEKDGQLGGQMVPGAAPPHKEGISLLVDYFESQLEKLGVRVELGKEAPIDGM